MPPPVVPRGGTPASGNSNNNSNFHPITLTMSMMDPPVGAHRPAPPTPPGLEISALVDGLDACTFIDSPRNRPRIPQRRAHHLNESSSPSTSPTPTPLIRRGPPPVFGASTKRFRQSGKNFSPFEKLTDDLVLKVFSYLSTQELCSCARVSRRFYHLAWDPKLWTSITFYSETPNPDRAIKVSHLIYFFYNFLLSLRSDRLSP